MPFFVAALISGFVSGFLSPVAIGALVVFAIAAYYSADKGIKPWLRNLAISFTLILALGLAMHKVPGFNNPVIAAQLILSAGAAPYTQYLNFDKAAVGLLLLVFLCARSRTWENWKETLVLSCPIALATTAVVFSAACLLNYVGFDFKLTSYTLTFLAVNLLFTCVAEEAFFRGFLQEMMMKGLASNKFGGIIAILISGILFGLVHAAGGPKYVFLTTLVGWGSAYAYARTRRIEAPIIVHFTVNAVHFIFFTYPFIQ